MPEAIPVEEWRVLVLTEVGAIFASLLEYESPIDVAVRLEAIAQELKTAYGDTRPLLPSTRPEINQLQSYDKPPRL
jgi:hypothetical protein